MKYEEYAKNIGFEKKEDIFVKEVNGFTVYMKDWQYMIMTIQSFYIPVDHSIDKKELKKYETVALSNACAFATFKEENDCLIVTVPEGKKNPEKFKKTCDSILSAVCELLKVNGYKPMSVCHICGQEAEYHRFGDNFIPTHQECIEKRKLELEELSKKDAGFKIQYIISIALSLIFASVGLLPALLLCIFNKDYFTGLIALVPILNVLGYFLGKAPNKKWLKIVTGLISFTIIVVFTCYALPYIASAKELTFIDYCFKGKMLGLRKIIFSTILSLGGFGGVKFLNKFKIDYKEELKKYEKKEN